MDPIISEPSPDDEQTLFFRLDAKRPVLDSMEVGKPIYYCKAMKRDGQGFVEGGN